MDVLGYEAVQKMVMEYVQYPVTPDFMLIAKAAFSLVRTLSSFEGIKGLALHCKIQNYMMTTLRMAQI